MPDPHTVLLIREYAVGTHRYELGLPKGRMDPGESILEAANRELKEEVGMGAKVMRYLRPLTLAPTYMSNAIHLVLAEDLYPERLPGTNPKSSRWSLGSSIASTNWPCARTALKRARSRRCSSCAR